MSYKDSIWVKCWDCLKPMSPTSQNVFSRPVITNKMIEGDVGKVYVCETCWRKERKAKCYG